MASDNSSLRHGLSGGDESADVREVLSALWRRKWHILACGFFLGLAFFTVTAKKAPIYTAEASLALDPRGLQAVSQGSQVVPDLDLSNAILESVVTGLQAEDLLRAVVQDIGIGAFEQVHLQRNQYGVLGALIDRVKRGISGVSNQPDLQVISLEDRRLSHLVFALRRGIHVERIGRSYVIRVQVSTVDAALSAKVANTLTTGFVAQQLSDRQRAAVDVQIWLEKQVDHQRKALLEAERAVQEFQHDWIASSGLNDALLEEQVAALNRKRAETRADMAAESARLGQLVDQFKTAGPSAVADAQVSDLFQGLRAKAQALLEERARLSASFGPNHPERVQILAELQLVRAEISAEVENLLQSHRNEVDVLKLRENSLALDVARLEAQRVKTSQAMLELRQLEAERDVLRRAFEDVSVRLEDVRAQSDIQRAEAHVVAAAQIPTGPSAPRPKLMGFFGATIGTSVGFVAVLALEALGPGFGTARALEHQTGLPVLAHLPTEPLARESRLAQLYQQKGNGLWLDRMRGLWLRLHANMSDGQKMLLVSSADRHSDQVPVAMALAKLAKENGLNVLLLQFSQGAPHEVPLGAGDLFPERRHVVPKPLGVDTVEIPLTQLSRFDGAQAHKMDEANTYDLVIINAPPFSERSDALRLAQAADQVLLVVKCRTSHRQAVAQAADALKAVRPAGCGMVFSSVPPDSDPVFS